MLVDTGAILTLLSERLYSVISAKNSVPLELIQQDIVAADGSQLKVRGKGNFEIKMDSYNAKSLQLWWT